MNKKVEDVDIDPFGEHESRPEEPTDEHITLDLCSGASCLQLPQENQLGNQHVNRKHHSEEESLKEPNQ